MSSVNAYFADLFGNTGQAVLVLDREKKIIYIDPLLEKFAATMSEQERASLHQMAEYCIRYRKSDILSLEQRALSLLPYPYEDDWYVVAKAEWDLSPEREELMVVLRNSREKITNYLNEIYGDAQILGLDSERGDSIGCAVRRILRTMNHIDMALDGSGQQQYRVPMDLGAVAESFVDAYIEAAPRAPVVIRKREKEAYASVMPENLELILGTLVSNALRFSGGQASLEITRSGHKVRITVCDGGPGAEDPARLFEAGYRTFDQKHVRGLGYSLFMAKKLAEQQGAALLYERRGNETCFHFEADAIDLPESGLLASWKPEDPDNSLSQLRIEMSDYVKEMDL